MRRLVTPKNLGFLGCRPSGIAVARIRVHESQRVVPLTVADLWPPVQSRQLLLWQHFPESSKDQLRPGNPPRGKEKNKNDGALSLRELRATAGTAEPVLFSLLHAPVSGEHTLGTQCFGSLAIESLHGSSNTESASTRLAGRPATINANPNINIRGMTDMGQHARHLNTIFDGGEILFDRSPVDHNLPSTALDSHPGHGRFASSGCGHFA